MIFEPADVQVANELAITGTAGIGFTFNVKLPKV